MNVLSMLAAFLRIPASAASDAAAQAEEAPALSDEESSCSLGVLLSVEESSCS